MGNFCSSKAKVENVESEEKNEEKSNVAERRRKYIQYSVVYIRDSPITYKL